VRKGFFSHERRTRPQQSRPAHKRTRIRPTVQFSRIPAPPRHKNPHVLAVRPGGRYSSTRFPLSAEGFQSRVRQCVILYQTLIRLSRVRRSFLQEPRSPERLPQRCGGRVPATRQIILQWWRQVKEFF
jgi:hypothetical protein